MEEGLRFLGKALIWVSFQHNKNVLVFMEKLKISVRTGIRMSRIDMIILRLMQLGPSEVIANILSLTSANPGNYSNIFNLGGEF